MGRFSDFKSFYPFYLSEHSDPTNRRLHYIGSALVIGLVITAILTRNPWWLLATPVAGYGFAWVGHFVFEKNKPATFQYPFYSFLGDWVMLKDRIIGRIRE